MCEESEEGWTEHTALWYSRVQDEVDDFCRAAWGISLKLKLEDQKQIVEFLILNNQSFTDLLSKTDISETLVHPSSKHTI